MTLPARSVEQEFNAVFDELKKATERYGPISSGHEGWAVIKEELDELWEEVRRYPAADLKAMRKEAMQVAAMAIRFMIDVCRE
jgi:hypothetical protein